MPTDQLSSYRLEYISHKILAKMKNYHLNICSTLSLLRPTYLLVHKICSKPGMLQCFSSLTKLTEFTSIDILEFRIISRKNNKIQISNISCSM